MIIISLWSSGVCVESLGSAVAPERSFYLVEMASCLRECGPLLFDAPVGGEYGRVVATAEKLADVCKRARAVVA